MSDREERSDISHVWRAEATSNSSEARRVRNGLQSEIRDPTSRSVHLIKDLWAIRLALEEDNEYFLDFVTKKWE